ncbi:MAG: glucosyl-3-phosphoglycerate synthase [Anaerolineales bacterium]|nr:glucosyl-3-phosphoglycerate synthase [Anaerolineales bacterium]
MTFQDFFSYRGAPPRTLIPVLPDGDHEAIFRFARWLSREEPVLLVGIVPIPAGENLSTGAEPARNLRALINAQVDRVNLRALARVRVTDTPWEDLVHIVSGEPTIRRLVLNWPQQLADLGLNANEILSQPPCDIVLVRGPLPEAVSSILVPMRGGPHAESALSLSLTVSNVTKAAVTSLRIRRSTADSDIEEVDFAGIARVLDELPQVQQETVVTQDMTRTILENSNKADLVVLGTSAFPTADPSSFGAITDQVLHHSTAAVVAVKTKRVEVEGSSRFSSKAISVLVDRWFSENTFHADEFADLDQLLRLKDERGVSISLALPALNEEETVGKVIQVARDHLMHKVPLLDEIVLMDSNSTDRTRDIARDLGIPVYIHQEILPEYGAREGKGEALWKSQYVTTGDILIWVDTDVENFHPRFIYGLLGPILNRSSLYFIKGFYRRPYRGRDGVLQPGRGGRVTELTARPLLNLLYPELSGIVQPLAGEYGGQRQALEQLTFASGYGVEISLLINAFENFRLSAIGQVDLDERIHRNQSLDRLSKMSFAIIQTVFSRLENRYGFEMIEALNRTMKTVKHEAESYYLEVEQIAELERPPMITIPEYRERRGLPLVQSLGQAP